MKRRARGETDRLSVVQDVRLSPQLATRNLPPAQLTALRLGPRAARRLASVECRLPGASAAQDCKNKANAAASAEVDDHDAEAQLAKRMSQRRLAGVHSRGSMDGGVGGSVPVELLMRRIEAMEQTQQEMKQMLMLLLGENPRNNSARSLPTAGEKRRNQYTPCAASDAKANAVPGVGAEESGVLRIKPACPE